MKNKIHFIILAAITFSGGCCREAGDMNEHRKANVLKKTSSSATIQTDNLALFAQDADAYLSANNGMGGVRTIFAQALMDGTAGSTKDKKLSDYYLLDVRPPADYAAGHISGAVNVPLGNVAKPEVLATFPTNRPILVICHTGHTASIATAILDCLGYDAWTLRFGMTAWRASSPTAVWSSDIKQDIAGGNYPVVTGTQP